MSCDCGSARHAVLYRNASESMKVLAIFPELHIANPGGVQVSGRIAWEMLQRQTDARALSFTNRFDVIRQARKLDFDADLVLVWHIDLLRVTPFLRTSAPRALFLHGIEAWRRHGWLTRKLLGDTRLIANSMYTVERATPFIPDASRARVVPLGVALPTPVTAPLVHPPAAIMIGRLDAGERYKGHHEAIRAWPSVQRAHPDAQLWIVGDGDLRAELEQEALDLSVGNAVRFFGRVTESEKDRLLAASRCLVLPSRAEGFGLVYLEAMRAGRPCVVGDDAAREVVADAGVAVDPSDRDAVANAIIELLELDATWETKSETARNRYADNFTATHFQNRLLDALRQLS